MSDRFPASSSDPTPDPSSEGDPPATDLPETTTHRSESPPTARATRPPRTSSSPTRPTEGSPPTRSARSFPSGDPTLTLSPSDEADLVATSPLHTHSADASDATGSARALLDHLKTLSARTRGIGAAIYRLDPEEGLAEVVVGIGRRIPPALDRKALRLPDGASAQSGRVWQLEREPDEVSLYIGGGDSSSPPLDLSTSELEDLRSHWRGTSSPPVVDPSSLIRF